MATFISTTLVKRTGASTTVFTPMGIDGSVGTLSDSSAAIQRLGNTITMSSRRSGAKRVSKIKVLVPLVDSTTVPAAPKLLSTAFAELTITIPDGTPTANANDLVGYLEKICASATVNFDSLLVKGEGVW